MKIFSSAFLLITSLNSIYASADYQNPNGNKEAAIKGSGAYRQEFERRVEGVTGFENVAKGLQDLSETINGPSLPQSGGGGASLEDHLAALTMASLKQNASLKGIGIKGDAIIDAIDADIKHNKKSESYSDISRDYEWKGELLLGIRDPGLVEKDVKAAYKAFESMYEYSEKDVEHLNELLSTNKYSVHTDPGCLQATYRMGRIKLAGDGMKKDVPEAIKLLTEVGNSKIGSSASNAYRSNCALIAIYAYGSEGVEKNLDKVVELSQRNAEALIKNIDDSINEEPICVAAQPFIQPIVADLKKISERAKQEEQAKKKAEEKKANAAKKPAKTKK